jgi:hypothetical protein
MKKDEKKELTTFEKLSAINVNAKAEKKNNLTYLSWAWAWSEVKKACPDATYEMGETEYDEALGFMCHTSVCIEGETLEMWLPVMDGANKSMKKVAYSLKHRSRHLDYSASGSRFGSPAAIAKGVPFLNFLLKLLETSAGQLQLMSGNWQIFSQNVLNSEPINEFLKRVNNALININYELEKSDGVIVEHEFIDIPGYLLDIGTVNVSRRKNEVQYVRSKRNCNQTRYH